MDSSAITLQDLKFFTVRKTHHATAVKIWPFLAFCSKVDSLAGTHLVQYCGGVGGVSTPCGAPLIAQTETYSMLNGPMNNARRLAQEFPWKTLNPRLCIYMCLETSLTKDSRLTHDDVECVINNSGERNGKPSPIEDMQHVRTSTGITENDEWVHCLLCPLWGRNLGRLGASQMEMI